MVLGGLPRWIVEKNSPASTEDVRDMGLIPGSERSPGGGHGNSHFPHWQANSLPSLWYFVIAA